MSGKFVLLPPSAFDKAHDIVTANDMIGDSHPSIRTLRLEFPVVFKILKTATCRRLSASGLNETLTSTGISCCRADETYWMVNWHVPLHPGMAAIATCLALRSEKPSRRFALVIIQQSVAPLIPAYFVRLI